MAPQVPGLFYSTKLQASLAWWKQPLNFASKKVVRYIEHGVKVEFKKGLPFAPKPSAPKFVDPQDVERMCISTSATSYMCRYRWNGMKKDLYLCTPQRRDVGR
jgi:hypothetical protein